MASRTDPIADSFGMAFEAPVPPKTARRAVVIPEIGLTLRRLNAAETAYDPAGKYLETRVELPNWKPGGVESLYGFACCEFLEPVLPNQPDADKATVGYQISNDDGLTWLTWDPGTTAWVVATGVLADSFVDKDTLDMHLPTVPFAAERQIRLRAKLTPGNNGRQRPVLKWTTIYHAVDLNLYEDVSRSIKRFIDAYIKVPMFYLAETSASPSVTIPTSTSDPATAGATEPGFDVKIEEPIRVFNLTTDPGRLNDIFGTITGRTVSFLGPQTGKVEVEFVGVPDVFIGAEEFFQLSKIPSVVVTVDRLEDYDLIRTFEPERERSKARCVGRNQPPRIHYNIYVSVRVQSSLKREALMMTDAISRILDKGDIFPSVALGDDYCVLEQTNQVSEDRVAQGLFVGNVTLRVLGKVWLKDPSQDIALVKKVNTLVGAQVSCNLNLPPHLRNVYRETSTIDGS
jgi:hypothetical protein